MEVHGPWNEALISANHQNIVDQLTDSPPGPVGVMVIVSGTGICGPDAINAMRQTAADPKVMARRIATAWAVPEDVEGRSLMPGMLAKIYAPGYAYAMFATVAEAEHWLNDRLDAAIE
jgi:hypothetical protein